MSDQAPERQIEEDLAGPTNYFEYIYGHVVAAFCDYEQEVETYKEQEGVTAKERLAADSIVRSKSMQMRNSIYERHFANPNRETRELDVEIELRAVVMRQLSRCRNRIRAATDAETYLADLERSFSSRVAKLDQTPEIVDDYDKNGARLASPDSIVHLDFAGYLGRHISYGGQQISPDTAPVRNSAATHIARLVLDPQELQQM